MTKIKDRTGEVHGLWEVISFDKIKNTNAYWWCKCKGCNKLFSRAGTSLGKVSNGCSKCRSCKGEESSLYLHGKSRSYTWNSWSCMIRRCNDATHDKYKYYGGRGIKVCSRWLDKQTGFINFLKDLGERPKNLELDRIDVNKNYTPDNCRWVTKKQNARNKRSNCLFTLNNKTQTLIEWAEEYNLHYKSLAYFLNEKKIPISEALKCARKLNN